MQPYLHKVLQQYNGVHPYFIQVGVHETFWGRDNKVAYTWYVRIGQMYEVGKGYGVTIEDACAQAGQAIIAFMMLPADRRVYLPVPETAAEDEES